MTPPHTRVYMLTDQFPVIDVTCCFRNRSIFGLRRLIDVRRENLYALLVGATLYFSRTTKQDIDTKHNSDLSTRDTMFNEILANRDARLTAELANRNARLDEIEQARSEISPEIRIEPTEEVELQDNDSSDQQSDENQSEASSAVDINRGVGKLSRDIIKNYYRRINDLKGSKLDQIGAWIDSKPVNTGPLLSILQK
ncbi:3273_t:CDS:2 [Ambispora leptoticha]|uniref:3273_t:CDS:1 n=1 Tax=Ambispora leptoticha TaxID=144679 RepID=A0A9N8VBQ3_9GLOM|nr:3273_t:CDS:2 [Ambispora leptoticha]